jgi:hypothetical protein
MTIATYADLSTAVLDWLGRPGDATFVGPRVPDLIAAGEQLIWYGTGEDDAVPCEPLRLRFMETLTDPASYVTTGGTATLALPAGFLGLVRNRRLSLATNPVTVLEFMGDEQIDARWIGSYSGKPHAYTLEGDNLRLAPTPDTAYGVSMAYYKKPDSLSVTPTNWLLTNAPMTYLYAALVAAAPFMKNDAWLGTWAQLYRSSVAGLMRSDRMDREGGRLVSRYDGNTP